jgi:sec-independent protein translocase protein TatA
MFPHLSLGELIVLLIVVLLLVGPQRLPELAASFGKSIKSFKEGLKDASEEKSDKKPPESSEKHS